jgi:hypothetical protein
VKRSAGPVWLWCLVLGRLLRTLERTTLR